VWPAVHVTDLDVGFIAQHIYGVVEQRTSVLATLKRRLGVCRRASVIPASNPVPVGVFRGINASCFGGIRILRVVHTIWVGSIADRSGVTIDSLYKLSLLRP